MTAVGWLPASAEDLFGPEATAEESYEVLTVDVTPTGWTEALRVARDELGCTYFDWLSAVDEPGTGLRVSAHVVALSPVRRLLVRTTVPHEAPVLPSAVDVYAGAAWHERETHEMFGITFEGHPALDHLLLPEGFEGHPLRKDFVLAARVAKAWPGAKEPGESDHGGPKRRQMLPPGVPDPNEWGPLKGQLPRPPPARPEPQAERRANAPYAAPARQRRAPRARHPPQASPRRRQRHRGVPAACRRVRPRSVPLRTRHRRLRALHGVPAARRRARPRSVPLRTRHRRLRALHGVPAARRRARPRNGPRAVPSRRLPPLGRAVRGVPPRVRLPSAPRPRQPRARPGGPPPPPQLGRPWHHARPAFDEPEPAAPEHPEKPATEPEKPAAGPAKPAAGPAKPAAGPAKPAAEPASPAPQAAEADTAPAAEPGAGGGEAHGGEARPDDTRPGGAQQPPKSPNKSPNPEDPPGGTQ
ncbi:NADH-quinone oxidoreductase subunit C [Streptomyces cynarae]|uniref:NADH-quinone oxidoreductase subunit C n=1 Tax=Streptomyces cynarae TaxID=2981134 RepID=UPI0036F19510